MWTLSVDEDIGGVMLATAKTNTTDRYYRILLPNQLLSHVKGIVGKEIGVLAEFVSQYNYYSTYTAREVYYGSFKYPGFISW